MTLTQIETRPPKSVWFRSPRVIRHGVMTFFLFLLHAASGEQVHRGGIQSGRPASRRTALSGALRASTSASLPADPFAIAGGSR